MLTAAPSKANVPAPPQPNAKERLFDSEYALTLLFKALNSVLFNFAVVSPLIIFLVTAPPIETFFEAVTAPLKPLISAESVARILISFKFKITVEVDVLPTEDVALLLISFITTVPPIATFLAASTETETPQILEVFSEFKERVEVLEAMPVTEPQ